MDADTVPAEWQVGVFSERVTARRSSSAETLDWLVVKPDNKLTVGREGDILIGVEPTDRSVSRRAVTVTVANGEWVGEILNSNGAYIYPWGLRAWDLMRGGTGKREKFRWPRIAVRVVGSDDLVHWVLLQSTSPSVQIQKVGATSPTGNVTDVIIPPPPLSEKQLEVLRTVFAPQIAWPPSTQPARQLKQAAKELGITDSGVQNRLEQVKKKALVLGLPADTHLTAPEVLHTLVAAGYVLPS